MSTASLERLAAEIEARRCRDRLGMYKLLGFAAGVVLAVVLAIEAWQFFGNDRPPPERLLAQATAVGNEVLALHSSRAQPFALESVRAELQSAPDPRRLAYEIVVVLRLQENLFGPADSNGAQAYLRMQQSVREAGDRMRRHRLYLHNPAVAEQTPMPLLLAVTHRAGERLEVRVPLAARRVGWAWRMDARPELMRTVGASFGGRVLAQFADTPYLIFGTPEARERMRPLIDHGRRFVLAVNAELEARGRRGGAGVGAN